jgi:hypothetical protein
MRPPPPPAASAAPGAPVQILASVAPAVALVCLAAVVSAAQANPLFVRAPLPGLRVHQPDGVFVLLGLPAAHPRVIRR